MTVGFFSPMPPARTGVADYSAALAAALAEFCEVRRNAVSADICLYHLGNNSLHVPIYREAYERPGVVVLHDAVLHHFFLGTLSRQEYVDEFAYNYGEWMRCLAGQLWEARSRSAADPLYFQYPMLKRIAEVARAVIVHNPAAARIVREHHAQARVHEIPHLFLPPPAQPAAAPSRWRQRQGIDARTFLFGVFGYLRESKRLDAVLRAFRTLRAEGLDIALLVAGDFVSSDLERALAAELQQPGIHRRRRVPDAEFWLQAAAVDACINLRHPAAGETSGIAIRLMGLGKPVLLSAGEEVQRFPESACLKIDPGVAELAMLEECMRLLAQNPATARAIGACAAAYIAEHHPVREVARRYWEILCAHAA